MKKKKKLRRYGLKIEAIEDTMNFNKHLIKFKLFTILHKQI